MVLGQNCLGLFVLFSANEGPRGFGKEVEEEQLGGGHQALQDSWKTPLHVSLVVCQCPICSPGGNDCSEVPKCVV
jgi:hypothetical protein